MSIKISELPQVSVVLDNDLFVINDNSGPNSITSSISAILVQEYMGALGSSAYTTVEANSATAWNVQALSGNWQDTFTSVLDTSANWDLAFENINIFIAGGTDLLVKGTSANWNSVYSSLHSLSSFFWNSSTSTVSSLSSNWSSVYSYVNSTSATNNLAYNTSIFAAASAQVYKIGLDPTTITPILGHNTASGTSSNVAGGWSNTASGASSNVAGGQSNNACGYGSNVAGGYCNTASGVFSNVAGGRSNNASGNISNVAGGWSNTASGIYSNVAGGQSNNASRCYSNVAGGVGNNASGNFSNVAGGHNNNASGTSSNVAGGCTNTASGIYSGILGGRNNNTNNQTNSFIIGSNITAPLESYTYVNNISSQGIVADGVGNSNQWNTAYNSSTIYQNNSATYPTFNYVGANYLPLSGGIVNGNTSFTQNLSVGGDITLFGNFFATGSATFHNTFITTTSSLSVINTGKGPALYVSQQSGPWDIATFNDGVTDIFHIGTSNWVSGLGRVGVNTSKPNVEMTVVGSISASNYLFGDGSNLLGMYAGSDLKALSGNWQNSTTVVNSNSANWNTTYGAISGGLFYLPLSGGSLTGAVSSNNLILANNIATLNQVDYFYGGVSKVYQFYNSSTNSLDTVFN